MKANRLGAALVSVIGVAMLGGCGWTARDTYRDAQKVSFTAARGDRSVIVFSPESSWPSPATSPSLADAR
ncbi:MAG: hypothetical protein IT437_11420 [Phycisphaerales bacterium]|nr:hypothetical protein [Phycisphaerales bacterium]